MFRSLTPSFGFSVPSLLRRDAQEQSQRVNTVSRGDGDTHHGLSLDPFAEKTVCCLLLEVSRLSLGVLNGFEVLLAELWPLRQAFVFTCTSDVLELEGGDAGEGEGLHIEPCLLSAEGDRTELSTPWEQVSRALMPRSHSGQARRAYPTTPASLKPQF